VSTGNRVPAAAAADGWHSIPSIHKPYKSRSELAGPVIVTDVEPPPGDRDAYYSSVGRQSALAFNRHAFRRNSSRSARSQPF